MAVSAQVGGGAVCVEGAWLGQSQNGCRSETPLECAAVAWGHYGAQVQEVTPLRFVPLACPVPDGLPHPADIFSRPTPYSL